MAGYIVKSGAMLRWNTRGDLTDRGSKSATVPSVKTLAVSENASVQQSERKIVYICFMTKRERIIHKILELSKKKYPDAEIYLYGSHARGDAKPLSDWDILILLNSENVPFSLETEIMDEFYNIELETGQIISPIIYPKKEWNTKYNVTPLFENINKEGIRLK
jgi:uncharacterized protein